ncbi:MAG: glycosyltransferase family 4 protein [Chitinophagales bacterium]|nr:glycosyltransferase family 4 protein [Chitinophagales bacterium]
MARTIICTVTNDLTYDQRMIRICSSLSEFGYKVILIGRLRKNSRPIKKETFLQKRFRCYFNKGKLFYLEYNIRLLFYLLFARYDGICAVDLDTILPAFICSRLRGKTCIYDAHEYFTEVPEVSRRPRTQKIWEILADFIIPRIQYAYTVGPCLAKIFEERYGTTFGVIRNVPFQTEKLPHLLPLEPSPKVILYQGALNEGRGLETAIDTMHHLNNAVLWLAGEGDLSAALRAQATQLIKTGKVRFWGFLPPDELKKLAPQAHIGLNLLENKGLSYYYSLANKAFDYIQAGLPSIHPSFPEYENLNTQYHTFVLLPTLSVSDLAEAIQSLLSDQELYAAMQQNCFKAAKTLNWEHEKEKLKDFYSSIKW